MIESKIISWNINGIKSWSETDEVFDFIKNQNIDILCVQETRSSEDKIRSEYGDFCSEFPFHYYHFGERKGYSGTAIFSKIKPINVNFGILNSEGENLDNEGRVITLEFEEFFIVNVYTPNSKMDFSRLDYRINIWDKTFRLHLKEIQKKGKELIVCGDMNVLERDIDIQNHDFYFKNREGFRNKVLEERKSFFSFLELGLVDIYRKLYPNKIIFSWVGPPALQLPSERLDYFLLSKKIENSVKDVEILSNQRGSDHLPICLSLNLKLLKDIDNEGSCEKVFFPKKELNQTSLF
ncbi:exodeoxyribonuclease III [Patescibacteria group bacterium]|nr:exodeoxyribonuclease III [Patescibacteria group bacterium]